ncbi:MAG: DNA mismatch endonuclease Vsr [Proteobacteria bacterium]|nr:DNA mismatch endonuclease Vsr [Pseudomonadota bacterium]
MVDVVSPADRSRMMSGIQGKNTKPELTVRRMLFASGYRFRLHRRDLPGAPDIVMPGRKVAIFVHGCFWHMHQGCRFAKMPATRPEFWKAKLEANVERDRRAVEKLRALGWRVLCVWECSTRDVQAATGMQAAMSAWLGGRCQVGEIGSPQRG